MSEIENLKELRIKYLNGNRRTKDQILTSLCLVHGYHRKSAIRVMYGELKRLQAQRPRKKRKPGVRSRYQDPGFKAALKAIWKETDYMCSKNLKRAMPVWLPAYEAVEGVFREDIRTRLLSISAASIDRVLKPYKHLGRGRCGTKPGSLLRSEIPIRTTVWDVNVPGFLEGDTVAHCGGDLSGQFVWSLTATDICTQWTEIRPVWHKGAAAVIDGIEDMYKTLPFAIQAWDCDNGAEFINRYLVQHFKDRRIALTRSRPYHKNDNAHVEQRNYSHVRQLLGYRRLDNREIVSRLTDVMRDYSLLKNLFYPSRKLVSKVVIGSYTKKLFDEPKTPYQRVLEHPLVDECQKERLRNLYSSTNPVLFKKQIFSQLRLLLRNASVTSQFEASDTPFGNTLI
jgi:hypothetical protein